MKLYAPDYYANFKCIASKCRHSCCIGWEIDIDSDTHEYYKSVDGSLGERLRKSISEEGCAHFVLDSLERCPFLNKDGLCDIICELGEDALCGICAEHPRFRSCFSDREEVGIGLCCEEAARIITEKKTATELVVISDDGEREILPDDEKEVLTVRSELFSILQNREKPLSERLSECLLYFGAEFEMPAEMISELLLGCEYMDSEWHDSLTELCTSALPRIPKELEISFEQLGMYFIYRYISGKLFPEDLYSTVAFCVFSVRAIMALCGLYIIKEGNLTTAGIAEVARAYSSEIEYSEENTEALISYFA